MKFSWRSDNSTSACYTCIARCCYGNSVRRSVRHMLICIETNAHIVKFFPQSGRGMNLVFWSLPPLQNSKRNCVSGGVKYTGVGTFAIFDWNRCISQKRYEIGPQLLWNTNRKSEAADRSVSIPMTLRDLERRDAMGQFFFWWISILRLYRLT